MKNIVERMIVPREAATGSLEYKDTFALFAPVAGTNKVGMAKFSPKEFDVANQTVSLKTDFASTITRKVDSTATLPDGIVFAKDGYKTPGVLYSNCQYNVAVDFANNEYVYESKTGSLFVTETLIEGAHILTEVFFADSHIWLRRLTIQGTSASHTEFLQADEDFHPYIADLQNVISSSTNGTFKFGGVVDDKDDLPLTSPIGTLYIVSNAVSSYGKMSAWVHVNNTPLVSTAYKCVSGDVSSYVTKLNNPTNQVLVQNGSAVRGVPLGTAAGCIPQYHKVDVSSASEGTLPVATPKYDGHAANKGYVDLNDVTSFDIEPAKDSNGTVVFGVYDFKVTLGNGNTVLTQRLDIPLEAIQIASVNDYIGDDGKRYLEIHFVDENIAPLNIELDEIFNIDILKTQLVEKLDSVYDEQAYVQDGNGNVSLREVTSEATGNAIVRRDASGNIKVPSEPDENDAVPRKYVDYKPPYDVETNHIGNSGDYVKLTIDNITDADGHVYMFRLVVKYWDAGQAWLGGTSVVTLRVNSAGNDCLVNTRNYPVSPSHHAVENGHICLYFTMPDTSDYGLFVKGLSEVITGASIECVEALPEDARTVISENITDFDVALNAPLKIVRRNSAGEVLITKCDSNNSAVSKKYVDNIRESYAILKKRVDNLEGAALDFIVDSTAAVTKTVPTDALSSAKIMKIGGMLDRIGPNALQVAPVTELLIEGANLLPFPYTEGGAGSVIEKYGITFTVNSDGSITINGTATGYATFMLSSNVAFKAGETYTRTPSVTGVSFVISYIEDGTTQYLSTSSFTWSRGWTLKNTYLQVNLGDTVNNVTFYPIINRGSTALPYRPYFKSTFPIPEVARPVNGINASACDYVAWEADGTRKAYVCIGHVVRPRISKVYTRSNGNLYVVIKPSGIKVKSALLSTNELYVPVEYSVDDMCIYCTGTEIIINDNRFTSVEAADSILKNITIYYELATPIVTDISDILPADNYIEVEGGGTITAVTERMVGIPTTIYYATEKTGG